jgi:hypothetical protein
MSDLPICKNELIHPKPQEKGRLNECMTFDDHILIFGTNQETGLGEVRIIRTNNDDHDNKMRNLCINMIFEAGRECSLLDAVHSAAEVFGTPKHVLDSIVEWAGFDPSDD